MSLICSLLLHSIQFDFFLISILVSISNVTTMGLKFRFSPRQFIFFLLFPPFSGGKPSRLASTSFDSRKTFVLSRWLFYRRTDALCFASRAPLVETNRPAFLVGSYSNYLKVLQRDAYFFHCSVPANIPVYSSSFVYGKFSSLSEHMKMNSRAYMR